MPKQPRSTTPTGQDTRDQRIGARPPAPVPESVPVSVSAPGSADRLDGPLTTGRARRARSAQQEGERAALTPATVWPSPPTGRSWPTGVIEGAVTAFSEPSDYVIVLAHPDTEPTALDTGRRGRGSGGLREVGSFRPPPAVPRGWAAEAEEIGIRLGRRTRVHMLNPRPGAPTEPTGQGQAAQRTAGRRSGPPTESTSRGSDVEPGGAHLLITVIAADEVPTEATAVVWATLLRTGGTLAVLTHSYHDKGRLVDPTGPIVAAGQNADLLYLQHIVAVHEPIPIGRDTPGGVGAAASGDEVVPPVAHRRNHTDVLVFQQAQARADSYFSAAAGGAA